MAPSNSSLESGEVFETLYPSVLECFIVILAGFVAGKTSLISDSEMKGLGTFVSTFSLPSMIFLSMATLDFGAVNWSFLLGVLLSKGGLFVGVIIVTLLLIQPLDWGRAGLYAIFCTQSNDFALGYPVVTALYAKVHKDFPNYFYLVAPISLVILNPIGFTLMEIQRLRNGEKASIMRVFYGILFNPIVAMTILGIVANLAFAGYLPSAIRGILEVFSSAFKATALFALGHRTAGNLHQLKGRVLVTCLLLVLCKGLILPLITREIVWDLEYNVTSADAWSSYAFLYGTIPTTPSVFVYASQYGLDVDLIGGAIVVGTFVSAPLMFVSAEMVALVPGAYLSQLQSFLLNIGSASLLCCVWTALMLILSARCRRLPHQFTLCLIIMQILSCVGVILWSSADNSTWTQYIQWFLLTFGVFGCRVWCALIALTLVLLRTHTLEWVQSKTHLILIAGWATPFLLVSALLLLSPHGHRFDEKHEFDPNFQYGVAQSITALVLLFICLSITMVSLVLFVRYERKYEQYRTLITSEENGEVEYDRSPKRGSIQSPPSTASTDDRDPLRHLGLLMMLTCSMLVGLSLCAWYAVGDHSGVFVELVFLDGVLNFGQGIIVFALFGLDVHCIYDVLQKKFPGTLAWISKRCRGDAVSLQYERFRQEHFQMCKDFFSGFSEVTEEELMAWLEEHDVTDVAAFLKFMIRDDVIKPTDNNTFIFK